MEDAVRVEVVECKEAVVGLSDTSRFSISDVEVETLVVDAAEPSRSIFKSLMLMPFFKTVAWLMFSLSTRLLKSLINWLKSAILTGLRTGRSNGNPLNKANARLAKNKTARTGLNISK